MGVVSASPARLRRYVDGLTAPDAALRDDLPVLRATLVLYRRANPDLGRDHTPLVDRLAALMHESLSLDLDVGAVASAFERLDEQTPAGDVHRVPAAAFAQAHAEVLDAWAGEVDLLDLVVDLDRDDWVRQVWGGWRCPPGLGDYLGSGGLVGPDGRVYPLVIPELRLDDTVAHVAYDPEPGRDPATLGGADAGWRVIDERTGVARVEEYEPTLFDRAAVWGAMATGLPGPEHRMMSPGELRSVAFGADGRPMVTEMPSDLPRDNRVDPPTDPTVPDAEPADRRRRSLLRGPAVVDFAIGAHKGQRTAAELHHAGHNLYRVLFEEHEDGGRRRARLHTYQLSTTAEGSTFVPYMAYAVGGQLRRKPVTPAPTRQSSMSPGPGSRQAGPGPQLGHGTTAGHRRDER